jgi:hypothetical protein
MKRREFQSIAIAGGAFIAFALAGRMLYPSEPEFVAESGAVADFYGANAGELLASNTLYLISVACLLWFAGSLCAALRRLEGGEGRVAAVALAGAATGAALMAAGSTADTVAALRVDENGAIDPQVATVMWDLNQALFGLAAPIGCGVLVLAVAALALRGVGLPRWYGAVSIPLGIALLVGPISYIAVMVFLFWVPATGVALVTAPEPRGLAADERTVAVSG